MCLQSQRFFCICKFFYIVFTSVLISPRFVDACAEGPDAIYQVGVAFGAPDLSVARVAVVVVPEQHCSENGVLVTEVGWNSLQNFAQSRGYTCYGAFMFCRGLTLDAVNESHKHVFESIKTAFPAGVACQVVNLLMLCNDTSYRPWCLPRHKLEAVTSEVTDFEPPTFLYWNTRDPAEVLQLGSRMRLA